MLFRRDGSTSHIDLNSDLIVVRGASRGTVPVATYAEILRDTYGASEVWPLVNIASGTTISAFVNSARNGVQTGWTLQNAAGPVTGTLAPLLDGTNDYGDILTSGGGVGLVNIWNGILGSFFGWYKVLDWGATTRRLYYFRGQNTNFEVTAFTGTNSITVRYRAAGVNKVVTISTSTSGWFSLGMAWSFASDFYKCYFNGAQSGSTQTGIGNWGSDAMLAALLGSFTTPPSQPYHGYQAYPVFKFGSVWSDADFAAMHAAAATAGPDV